MSIAENVHDLVLPITEKYGLQLWDVEFKKESGGYVLRISIDKDEGVSIEDCEKVSRDVDPLLDEADFIEQSYCLEVTSAGLVRELKKDEHILKFVGKQIKVKLYKAIDDSKTWEGILDSYENGILSLKCGDRVLNLERQAIAKIVIDLV